MEVKTAIVTGGNGGLGRALLATLKKSGWQTVSIDTVNSAVDEPSQRPDLDIIADVSNSQDVSRAFNSAQEFDPAPKALICLAGVVFDAPVLGIARGGLHTYPEESWRRTLDVNLTGTFLCAREFVERLVRKRLKGTIITCSSPAAQGAPGQSAYAASKAGVEAFTSALSQEIAPFGIRVCGFRPALTQTPMAEKYPQHIMNNLAQKSLLKRFARPEEIAEGILFMLSSELVSGRILELDGGLKL